MAVSSFPAAALAQTLCDGECKVYSLWVSAIQAILLE